MDMIMEQLKIFVGLIGVTIAAFIGLLARHVYHEGGLSLKRVGVETPVAIFSGIFAFGIGEYYELGQYVVIAIASTFAYLGPQLVFGVLKKIAELRLGVRDAEQRQDQAEDGQNIENNRTSEDAIIEGDGAGSSNDRGIEQESDSTEAPEN